MLSVMSLSLRASSSANAISLITSTIVVTSPRKKNPRLLPRKTSACETQYSILNSQYSMVNGIRFFREAGFFHDEIEILEKDNVISDKTVWELAHKQDYH